QTRETFREALERVASFRPRFEDAPAFGGSLPSPPDPLSRPAGEGETDGEGERPAVLPPILGRSETVPNQLTTLSRTAGEGGRPGRWCSARRRRTSSHSG